MKNVNDHKKRKPLLFLSLLLCLASLFFVTSCGRLPEPAELAGTLQEISGLLWETGKEETEESAETAETAESAETAETANPPSAETTSQESSFVMAEAASLEASSAPDPLHIPHEADRFYISNLDPALKKDFLALYQSVQEFEPSCTLPDHITPEQADLLVTVLRFDCPEIFQIDDSNGYTLYTLNEKVARISIPYSMEKDEYLEKYQLCFAEVQKYVRQIAGLNDFEKERYVYDTLAGIITYTLDGPNCQDACGALLEHRAKCDGISLALKWIMEESGITSMLISGSSRVEDYNHAWNCLKLDGAFYDLDLTNDTRAEDGSRTINLYGAYNTDRSWIGSVYPVSDILLDNFDLPETQKGHSFHELNGSYVPAGSDVRQKVWLTLDNAYEGNGTGYLQFASPEDYRNFLDHYDDYVHSWFEERRRSGSFNMNAIDEFRTAVILIRPAS